MPIDPSKVKWDAEPAIDPSKVVWDVPEATPSKAGDGQFEFGEMVSNIPSSAYQMGADIYQAVRHPVQTGKAVGKGITGGAQLLTDLIEDVAGQETRFSKSLEAMDVDYRREGEAIINALKDRYGSVEAAKNTLEQDPVGFAVDLASLAAPVSKTASAAINPINVAKNVTAYGAGKVIPKGMPKSMYEDVAKFSTTIPQKQRSAMIDTAMKHRLMPTGKGVAKLEGMIDGLNTKLDDLIKTAQAEGKTIPRQAIYKHLKDLREQKGGVRLDAPGDLDAINRIVGDFEQYIKGLGKDQLTPMDLQKLKTEAYKSINWDAKRATGTPIKEDVYKTVARGAKEGVEQMVPEVQQLNRQLGELYELQPSLSRSASRIDQRNIIPIDAPLQIGAGTAVGGGTGAAMGTLASILGLPKVKAGTALKMQDLIDNAQIKRFIENNPYSSMAQLATILAGRTTDNNQQP